MSTQKELPAAWRVEGRPNPFVPWVVVAIFKRLEDACTALEGAKRFHKFYAVRVRAN